MKEFLRNMMNGWVDHINVGDPDVPLETHMLAYANDEREAYLLTLFSHWSAEIEAVAAHYGLGIVKITPEGKEVWSDSTVDNYLIEGTHKVVDIPLPPSSNHYWHAGRWQEIEDVSDREKL